MLVAAHGEKCEGLGGLHVALPKVPTGLQRTPRQLQSGWAATHAVLLPDHQQFFFRRQDNAADADVVGGEGGDMGAMHKQASEQDIVVARMVEIEAAVDGLGYQRGEDGLRRLPGRRAEARR